MTTMVFPRPEKKEANARDVIRYREKRKEYYQLHKTEILKRNKQHRKKTLTARNLYCKQYRLKNKEKELARNREYYNNKANTDMDYKLNRTLRARINMAIKLQYGIKSIKSIELLGADIDTVRQYLESKFQKGMSWENHGTYGWHIDHVKPCDAFDLTDPNQQKECFNYKNLQPLWAEENLKKGKKC